MRKSLENVLLHPLYNGCKATCTKKHRSMEPTHAHSLVAACGGFEEEVKQQAAARREDFFSTFQSLSHSFIFLRTRKRTRKKLQSAQSTKPTLFARTSTHDAQQRKWAARCAVFFFFVFCFFLLCLWLLVIFLFCLLVVVLLVLGERGSAS